MVLWTGHVRLVIHLAGKRSRCNDFSVRRAKLGSDFDWSASIAKDEQLLRLWYLRRVRMVIGSTGGGRGMHLLRPLAFRRVMSSD